MAQATRACHPLADIHAIRRVATVMTAGRLYDARGLWQSVGFQP